MTTCCGASTILGLADAHNVQRILQQVLKRAPTIKLRQIARVTMRALTQPYVQVIGSGFKLDDRCT